MVYRDVLSTYNIVCSSQRNSRDKDRLQEHTQRCRQHITHQVDMGNPAVLHQLQHTASIYVCPELSASKTDYLAVLQNSIVQIQLSDTVSQLMCSLSVGQI